MDRRPALSEGPMASGRFDGRLFFDLVRVGLVVAHRWIVVTLAGESGARPNKESPQSQPRVPLPAKTMYQRRKFRRSCSFVACIFSSKSAKPRKNASMEGRGTEASWTCQPRRRARAGSRSDEGGARRVNTPLRDSRR